MKNNLKSLTAIIMTLIMLVNIFPISVFPVGNASMSLTASSVSGEAGDTVEVEISVSDNPGIASLKFDVEYSDYLTLEGVVFNSAFGPYATTPPVYKNPQSITLVSPYADCTVNGVLATLTFSIADDAPAGDHDILLSYYQNETYNSNFDDVSVRVTDGCVTVEGEEPEEPLPADGMTLSVGTAEADAGDTFEVDVTVDNNPGIASLKFDVEYSDYLTLEGVTFNSAFGPYATTPPTYNNPQRITLVSPYSDCAVDGVLATLTFRVADNAPSGDHDIMLTYYQNETYNSNFEDVAVTVISGYVSVEGGTSEEPEPVEGLILTADSVYGMVGKTVEVDITIGNNPGISSLKFDVEYGDGLTLEDVTFNDAFGPYATTPPVYGNPQKITLVSPYSDCTVNGVLATLTFSIADDTELGEQQISLTYVQNETYNAAFEDVAVSITNGSVTVIPYKELTADTYLDCEYEISDRVVTVKHTAPCKVGYLLDGKYIALDAVQNDDGSYSFTAPAEAGEVLIVLKGDSNHDGRVTAADIARINAHKLGKTTIDADQFFAGDADSNGKITDADLEALTDDVLRTSPLEW